MKSASLRLLSAFTVIILTQCTWPEPRYDVRYHGPSTPRAYHHDPIFGESYFGYVGLKTVAASPLWARLHNWETNDCCRSDAGPYEPLPMPAASKAVTMSSHSGLTPK